MASAVESSRVYTSLEEQLLFEVYLVAWVALVER